MIVQFNTLKQLIKIRTYNIDNLVFKLHYRLSFIIFIACSILVTLRQFVGDHIRCVINHDETDEMRLRYVETFCFITTTFTVPKYFNVSSWKGIVFYPGVGPMQSIPNEEDIRRHAYYQWVPFVLILQGLAFLVPHILWKSMEGGKLRRLTEGFHTGIISERENIKYGDHEVMSRYEKNERFALISTYVDKKVLGATWTVGLVLCEHLNLINVIAQAFLIHLFLGRQFFGLGIYVINHGLSHDVTILEYIFPKECRDEILYVISMSWLAVLMLRTATIKIGYVINMTVGMITKCTYHKYGPSGTIESHDAMCILPLNVINDKIYVFLWFWLLFVSICSTLVLIYRHISIVLHGRSRIFNQIVFTFSRPVKFDIVTYACLAERYNYTEWLFLVYLEQNMHGSIFREFIRALHDEPLIPEESISYDPEDKPLHQLRNYINRYDLL